ncbi:MerR family transcriptional regulator [bacterium]|nr:MerR family transcriptional regulator [candidate division CSSED10-310 bacterium]
MTETSETTRPKYRISVIAEMLNIHPQTIRTYERLDLIRPARSAGNTRLFSDRDVKTIRTIQSLTQDMGVNLAGVEIILRMIDQIDLMHREARLLYHGFQEILEREQVSGLKDLHDLKDRCRWLMVNDGASDE